MPAQIIGNGGVVADVDGTTFRALRTTGRPIDYGSLGYYRVSAVSGTMAAALAANSEVFQFRWPDATRFAVVTRVAISAGANVAATAAAFGAPVRRQRRKCRCRSCAAHRRLASRRSSATRSGAMDPLGVALPSVEPFPTARTNDPNDGRPRSIDGSVLSRTGPRTEASSSLSARAPRYGLAAKDTLERHVVDDAIASTGNTHDRRLH